MVEAFDLAQDINRLRSEAIVAHQIVLVTADGSTVGEPLGVMTVYPAGTAPIGIGYDDPEVKAHDLIAATLRLDSSGQLVDDTAVRFAAIDYATQLLVHAYGGGMLAQDLYDAVRQIARTTPIRTVTRLAVGITRLLAGETP